MKINWNLVHPIAVVVGIFNEIGIIQIVKFHSVRRLLRPVWVSPMDRVFPDGSKYKKAAKHLREKDKFNEPI